VPCLGDFGRREGLIPEEKGRCRANEISTRKNNQPE
jgi:hypothetical protein